MLWRPEESEVTEALVYPGGRYIKLNKKRNLRRLSTNFSEASRYVYYSEKEPPCLLMKTLY